MALQNDYKEARQMFDIMKKQLFDELRKEGFTRARQATVTAVSGTNITAYLAGDESTLTSVYQNRTGQTIAVNDIVYIVMPNNNLTNAFIGWKR